MSSQAYSPGLKRKELTLVSKTRRLPVPGEVLVKEGQTVTPDSVVARANVPGEPVIVKVAQIVSVELSRVEKYMLKKVGETVKKDEVIAKSESLFGLIKKVCLSPIDGTIENVSKVTGQAIIRSPPIPVDVKAYIHGIVTQVLPKEGVIIDTPATFIQGIFGIGGETYGQIKVLADHPDDILTAEQITPDCVDKILVGGSLVTSEALQKAVKVRAKGIVVGGIRGEDLIDFLGYKVGVAITGQEEVGITLIITEGFGKMRIAEITFELLKKSSGELASISGATQIRAGVIRPEIIIPLTLREDDSIKHGEIEEDEALEEGLQLGTPIRIIREPHFGALGHVVSLPIKLQSIETESYVRVLEAQLADGRRVSVPRANVEIIEE